MAWEKIFYETKPNARRIFDEADKVLDFDIKKIFVLKKMNL